MLLNLHRLISAVLLTAIAVPACFGFALHLGQDACCTSLFSSRIIESCACGCRHQPQPVAFDRPALGTNDECRICSFLVLAKHTSLVNPPDFRAHRLADKTTHHDDSIGSCHLWINASPRGPPAHLN